MKKQIFKPELDFIKDQNIMEFTEEILTLLPENFWVAPASSSGTHHPEYAKGEGGLVRHTIAATNIAKMLLELTQFHSAFDSKTCDCIISALILHDGLKFGFSDANHTKPEHAIDCCKLIKLHSVSTITMSIFKETIGELVRTHMGQWDSDNCPITEPQSFVHMCDYLASRNVMLFDFGDRETRLNKLYLGVTN